SDKMPRTMAGMPKMNEPRKEAAPRTRAAMALPLVGFLGFLAAAVAVVAAALALPAAGTWMVCLQLGQRAVLPANSSPTWNCLPHVQEKTIAMIRCLSHRTRGG